MSSIRPHRQPWERFFGRSLAAFGGAPCPYCGCAMAHQPLNGPTSPTREHFVPLVRGGPDTSDNVMVCCRDCNELKGDLLATEWLPLLEVDGDPRASRVALILDVLPTLRARCEAAAAAELVPALELA